MRPPLLSDDEIRAAMRDVAATSGRVTGIAVRKLLAARHGARGGVARIYRLLREAQRPVPSTRMPAGSRTAFDETRESAIARADLAEERERVHQQRWARETDILRTRLASADAIARDADDARARLADLSRALGGAQARIAALERAIANIK